MYLNRNVIYRDCLRLGYIPRAIDSSRVQGMRYNDNKPEHPSLEQGHCTRTSSTAAIRGDGNQAGDFYALRSLRRRRLRESFCRFAHNPGKDHGSTPREANAERLRLEPADAIVSAIGFGLLDQANEMPTLTNLPYREQAEDNALKL